MGPRPPGWCKSTTLSLTDQLAATSSSPAHGPAVDHLDARLRERACAHVAATTCLSAPAPGRGLGVLELVLRHARLSGERSDEANEDGVGSGSQTRGMLSTSVNRAQPSSGPPTFSSWSCDIPPRPVSTPTRRTIARRGDVTHEYQSRGTESWSNTRRDRLRALRCAHRRKELADLLLGYEATGDARRS